MRIVSTDLDAAKTLNDVDKLAFVNFKILFNLEKSFIR